MDGSGGFVLLPLPRPAWVLYAFKMRIREKAVNIMIRVLVLIVMSIVKLYQNGNDISKEESQTAYSQDSVELI
jgi:hypothetical protein